MPLSRSELFALVSADLAHPIANYTTLQAGGPAEAFVAVDSVDALSQLATLCQSSDLPITTLGWGSNMLVSDAGLPGLVVHNRARKISLARTGEAIVDSGAMFQEFFLKAAQIGLAGLEYAVGIPGSVGGALVSNAGAYRSSVSEFLTEIEVVDCAARRWVEPDWMGFEYRDSRLRREGGGASVILRARFQLPRGDTHAIYAEAREYQRQRISKQPPQASAGSFFKNVLNPDLAQRLPNLPTGLKEKGIIPSGFLIEAVGMKGFRTGRCAFGELHANFIVNLGGATATAIRQLAERAKLRVFEAFGVWIEEEVLYLGDWSPREPH